MSSILRTLVARDDNNDVDCESVNAQCALSDSFYGYFPSLAANTVFLVLFIFMWIAHGGQGIYYRSWSTFAAMNLGCLCEVLGYIGRLMMHHNPYNLNGVYLFGQDVSSLKPINYIYIFIFCDLVSLALQGAGGGLASVAAQNNDDMATGDNTQLAGLVFQVASLALFAICCAEYAWRVWRNPAASARVPTVFSQNKNLKAKAL
ncbi:uncharacterized protein KY384_007293 [Bacidia gigantensis]|uniref:uncharacterized protein n=1 Tax=Bacidia gigantensis TaxID=2732470 RepID=UPI001D04917E|nr:uncharacterized protein KY384_007293 [Bacidia gigantensis]KAG8528375.1 hypothetical protein KY384_007293 [Bacidia gigantensis]